MSELKNILCVEDDPDIQAIIKLALETVGDYCVKICSSGKEALEIAEQFEPQILLLDVMMPTMDGPDILKKLRNIPALAHTPAIFITAKIQAHEVSQYKKTGILEVIGKPFDPMTLARQINEIWKQYEA